MYRKCMKTKTISAQDDVPSILYVNQKENAKTYNYFPYVLSKNRICKDLLQIHVYLSQLEHQFKTYTKIRLVGV